MRTSALPLSPTPLILISYLIQNNLVRCTTGAVMVSVINLILDALGTGWTFVVFAGACVSVFGCALQAGAVNMVMLIIGRFIAGVAVGMLTSVVPMYAGEMAEASSRGMMSGLLQWMLSWGYLVAQWLGYGCSFIETAFQCTNSSQLMDN